MHRTVGDFIIDLADNSLEAGATRIDIGVRRSEKEIAVTIRDNGGGMDEALLQRVRDPYYTDGTKHPGRKVGLGIPFLIQAVEQCEGDFSISSVPGKGTEIRFSLPAEHIDTPPLGDVGEAFALIVLKQGDYEAVLDHCICDDSGERRYRVSRSELIDALGELESAASQSLVRQFLTSHEEDIRK